jgi:mono/diheme cytochrome c family protein
MATPSKVLHCGITALLSDGDTSCHSSLIDGPAESMQDEELKAMKPVKAFAALAFALIPLSASAAAGWYTKAQAEKGHQLFNNYCAQCHRPDLSGAAGPALVGPTFLGKWGGKTVSDLYAFEHEKMPAINPGSMPPDQLWPITAYILEKNGFKAGSTELDDKTAGDDVLAAK